MASCPDSDNSWVLAGSESLPVETLGPGPTGDPDPQRTPPAPWSPSKADGEELAGTVDGEETLPERESSQAGATPPPEETEAQDVPEGDGHDTEPPGSGDAAALGDAEETPVVADLGPDTQEPEDQSFPQGLPSPPSVAWTGEAARCTSSEEDTDADAEGLRRRRRGGGEPGAAPPAGPLRAEAPAGGEGGSGEPGISLNMCLLGALVLLGLGVLLFSGGLSESENGALEEVEMQVFPDATADHDHEMADAVGDGQDGRRQQLQAPAPPDGAPSLQSMALLLDKLAKENQDIRLLQAQLQAQKEELQSLMQRPDVLEAENAQLRGALQHGEASQRALAAELQQLRARLQGLEAACPRGADGACLGGGGGPRGARAPQEPGTGFREQKERLEAEAQALRQELERQQRLLGSVQRDLEQSLREAGRGGPAHAGLAELGHRLAQELRGLGAWGQHPGVPGNASDAGSQEPPFQSPRERGGKEKWRGGPGDRQAEPGKRRKESWGGKEGREGKPRAEEEEERGREGKRQGPKEAPRKHGSPRSSPGERQKHPQWKEGQHDPPPPPPWAELSRHKYRAPRGCAGVRDCARQEGLALFGVELAPVRRQELASLLRAYLARLPWARPLAEEEPPLSPAYFGEDGVFRHDRLRFRDFVDALEDSLEEEAERRTGDDDAVDDFEDFILGHFFGDKALRKRSGKKDKHAHSARPMGPREEHSHHRRG